MVDFRVPEPTPEQAAFRKQLNEALDRFLQRLQRHRERYVRAWIAATGLHPLDAMIVEEDTASGKQIYVTRSPKGQRLLEAKAAAWDAQCPDHVLTTYQGSCDQCAQELAATNLVIELEKA